MPFATFTKEEDSWFSDDDEETLEDLSGSKGTIFLEGMDTFINNTKQSEIPGVFKGYNLLNSGTIRPMGADSKKAETWTQVSNTTSRTNYRQPVANIILTQAAKRPLLPKKRQKCLPLLGMIWWLTLIF